eukprot:6516787-Prymnesium_polylepis.1
MHGATVPRRPIPIGAPFVLPTPPPPDDRNSSTWVVAPLLAVRIAQSPYGNVVASHEEDRDGLEVTAAAGAR